MNVRDTLERLFWTVCAAFLGALGVSDLIDISAVQAGITAAASAGVNFLLIVARHRLSVLPEPGEGLPGLPTDEGQSVVVVALIAAAVCLVMLLLFDVVHIG